MKKRKLKSRGKLQSARISAVSTVMLVVVILLCMFPFYIMIVGAFKPSLALNSSPMDLNPFNNLTLNNVRKVLEASDILLWMKNTFIISISDAVLTSFFGVLGGYAFARIDFRGKQVLFTILMATMMMPGHVLLIPNFLVAKNLGLVNRMVGVILTSISPAFGIFLSRQFISSLSSELFEAAELDGCGEVRKFFNIALPLSAPAIGTIGIFAFFGSFNGYLWQLIMISDTKLITLPIGIQQLAEKWEGGGSRGPQLALALLATVPVTVLFLLCQKFFIKGISEGSAKG